jgi:hypothetical protein
MKLRLVEEGEPEPTRHCGNPERHRPHKYCTGTKGNCRHPHCGVTCVLEVVPVVIETRLIPPMAMRLTGCEADWVEDVWAGRRHVHRECA